MDYFKSEQLNKHLMRIIDMSGTAMYLVMGSKRACLIDTGCGIGNLKKYVETLCDLPMDVILTHGHFDHSGGADVFDRVYMNVEDIPVYDHNKELLKMMKQKEDNPLYDLVLSKKQINHEAFLPLQNGQIFDLGDIHLEMVSVAGHTQGMMMVLIQELRTMIFGDACGEGVMLFEDTSSDVSTYRRHLLHLKENFEERYDIVLRNHGTFVSDCDILDHVLECCNLILEGKDDRMPADILPNLRYYHAKAVDEKGNRLDGLHGNILYREDKGH